MMAVVPMPLEPPWTRKALARLQCAAFENVGPYSEECFRQAGCFYEAEAIGYGQGVCFGDGAVLGIAATGHQSANLVACLETLGIGWCGSPQYRRSQGPAFQAHRAVADSRPGVAGHRAG